MLCIHYALPSPALVYRSSHAMCLDHLDLLADTVNMCAPKRNAASHHAFNMILAKYIMAS